MALGDKVIDYNFYGATYIDAPVVNNVVQETNPVAKVVQTDTYDYNYNTSNYGKPLNDTIALWKINGKSSFNKMAFALSSGSTLNYQITSTPNPGYSYLAMQMTNNWADYYAFVNRPDWRFAYGQTNAEGYKGSRLCADIDKTKFCLSWAVARYNKDDDTIGAITYAGFVNYFNSHPNTHVIYVKPILFRGYNTPRLGNGSDDWSWIPTYSGQTAMHGYPVFDTLADFIIPENATYALSQVGSNKIYAPFTQAINANWYDGSPQIVSPANCHQIGFSMDMTISSIINGISGHERGRFIHCNFETRDFEDVTYRWRLVAYYREGRRELENGFNLSSLPSNHHIRFHTSLEIINRKGLSYGEACLKAVLHEYAYMGFYFAKTDTIAANAILGTSSENLNDIFLPEFVGGVTTGRYFTGNAILNVPYADSNSVSDIYHPDEPSENAKTGFPDEVIGIPRFGATYLCTIDDIENLNYNLKTMDWSDQNLEELFFGQNPFDFIISATAYPLIEYPAPITPYQSDVMLGKLNVNTLPQKIGDCTGYRIMGGIVIYPNPFGDLYVTPAHDTDGLAFLDYEPYTKLQLYLPYAEMVSIPPEVFMGKTIGIRMGVDFMSGNVIYYIYVKESGMLYTSTSGNMATEIPISGRDYTEYQRNQLESVRKMTNTALDTVTNVLGHRSGASVSESFKNEKGRDYQNTMAFASAGRGIANLSIDLYECLKTAPSPVSVSTGSASLGTACEQDARLYILRPKLPENFNKQTFKKVYGKATAQPGKLSDCSGFTIMLNPILDGIDCTAEEKMMIIEALKGGVIV